MKKIVILGAGFAGVRTALCLSKKLKKHQDIQIILVSRHSYHSYTPSLYEVATAYRGGHLSDESIKEHNFKGSVSAGVAFHIEEILEKSRVEFVCDEVVRIDAKHNTVELKKNESLEYDYCVVALGSHTAYFGVEGAEQYGLSIKTIADALKIRDAVREHIQKTQKTGKATCIAVIGGGLAGFETATEMQRYLSHLVKQEDIDPQKVKVVLVEGQDTILAMCSSKMSRAAQKRCDAMGIETLTGKRATKIEPSRIVFSDKSSLSADVVVWSCGIQATFLEKLLPDVSLFAKNGQAVVSPFLNTHEHKNLFVAGDSAFVEGAPDTAYIAEQHAETIAHNIVASMNDRDMQEYEPHLVGFVASAGGKYAFADLKIFIPGFFGWFIKRVIDFRYIFTLYPLVQSVKMWYSSVKLFARND